MAEPLTTLAALFDEASVPYAFIGAHAVNAWLEPRFTADVDIVASAGAPEVARLRRALAEAGYRITQEHGAALPSGPDFVRYVSGDGAVTLEIQAAKTAFQHDVIRRAQVIADGARVASVEDLIVMKLIADRSKDQIDLIGLIELSGIDWSYVERRATEWEVIDRLRRVRATPGR